MINFICILLLTTFTPSYGNVAVTYTLTTRDSVSSNFTNNNYTNVAFNKTQKFKILCHGWTAVDSWYVNITREYLKKDANLGIIAAYYAKAVSNPNYYKAIVNVPTIGEIIGNLTISLNVNLNISLENFHCIGHSLGAHICGIAGETINASLGIHIARITGLDPAGPAYKKAGFPYTDKGRLSIEDAVFVDIIHSSSKYGVNIAIGTIDFFPNFGENQPGCINNTNIRSCNHRMAVVFFIKSINNITFVASKVESSTAFGVCKIDSCEDTDTDTVLMGDPVQMDKYGSYYLTTNVSLIVDYYSIFR